MFSKKPKTPVEAALAELDELAETIRRTESIVAAVRNDLFAEIGRNDDIIEANLNRIAQEKNESGAALRSQLAAKVRVADAAAPLFVEVERMIAEVDGLHAANLQLCRTYVLNAITPVMGKNAARVLPLSTDFAAELEFQASVNISAQMGAMRRAAHRLSALVYPENNAALLVQCFNGATSLYDSVNRHTEALRARLGNAVAA